MKSKGFNYLNRGRYNAPTLGRSCLFSSGKEPKRNKQDGEESKGRQTKKELDAIQKFIELSEASKRLKNQLNYL